MLRLLALLAALALGAVGTHAQERGIASFTSAADAADFVKAERGAAASRGARARLYQFRAEGAEHLVYFELPGADRLRAHGGYLADHRGRAALQARSTPDDPRYAEQWNLDRVDAEGAWEYTTGGVNALGHPVVTGVIELTGYDFDRAELADALFANPGETAGNGLDDDGNGLIDDVNGYDFRNDSPVFSPNMHGTRVAAVLGATTDNDTEIASLNWSAALLPTVVRDIDQWTVALDYYTALRERYNRTAGAEGVFLATVNMSLGAPRYSCDAEVEFQNALARAARAGILLVGATDNEFGLITPVASDFPSTCTDDLMLIVTASDTSDAIYNQSRFSTEHVDLAAPGAPMPSLPYGGGGDTEAGTSLATPHVTATIALIYSLDCEELALRALADPQGTARLVRDAVVNNVDRVPALAGLVATGGRLNARRAIEAVLETACLDGDVLLRFRENTSAATSYDVDGVALTYQRQLSERWNVHLYRSDVEDVATAMRAAAQLPEVAGVEGNLQLRREAALTPDTLLGQRTGSVALGLADAHELVYGEALEVGPSAVVTAVLDRSFAAPTSEFVGRYYVNADEVPGNQLDDDDNGYVDDVRGVNLAARAEGLREGRTGAALAATLLGSPQRDLPVQGVDLAGSILPIQGSTLDHWVEAADYVYTLRERYNASGGTEGALVSSLVLPQGGERYALVPDVPGVLEGISEELYGQGILSIASVSSDRAPGARSVATSVDAPGWLAVDVAESADPDRLGAVYYLPGRRLAQQPTAIDTLALRGSSGAAMLLAGTVSLLYQTPCAALATRAAEAPSDVAEQIVALLQRSSTATEREGVTQVRADYAVDYLAATCTAQQPELPCRLYGLSPNPGPAGVGTRLTYGSAAGRQTCMVSVVDALGRELMRERASAQPGYNVLELGSERWPAGVYYVRFGDGESSSTLQLLRR